MTLLENPHFQQEIHLQMENFMVERVFVGFGGLELCGNMLQNM